MTSRFVVTLFCLTATAFADPVLEAVSVDTSSLNGTSGSLDFNFNPGTFVTQSASLQILNFSSDGALAGSPSVTGDVSGTLPGTLTFDNGTALSDYFEGFTFGNVLKFDVSLYGPALSSPDGTSSSGSSFGFSMFSDPFGTTPALTSDLVDGIALTILVNLDGSTNLTDFSSETSGESLVSPVPEPAGSTIILLLLLGIRASRSTSGNFTSTLSPLRPNWSCRIRFPANERGTQFVVGAQRVLNFRHRNEVPAVERSFSLPFILRLCYSSKVAFAIPPNPSGGDQTTANRTRETR